MTGSNNSRQAAQRIEDMRVDICDAIEAIPEVIEKAQNFGQLHPTAAKLRDYTAKLYVAILKVLHLAIGWYGRKCSLKAFDAFVHGKAYDRELSDALQTLKRLEGRIEQEAGLQDQFQDRRCELSRFKIESSGMYANLKSSSQIKSE